MKDVKTLDWQTSKVKARSAEDMEARRRSDSEGFRIVKEAPVKKAGR